LAQGLRWGPLAWLIISKGHLPATSGRPGFMLGNFESRTYHTLPFGTVDNHQQTTGLSEIL
jgi:hypothetical protein